MGKRKKPRWGYLAAILFAVLTVPVGLAETLELAYANGRFGAADDSVPYKTFLTCVNETGVEKVFEANGWQIILGPYETREFSWPRNGVWPVEGLGSRPIAVPDGVRAFSDIYDPDGKLTRVEPLSSFTGGTVQLQGIKSDGRFRSFIFVQSEGEVTVAFYQDAEFIRSVTVGGLAPGGAALIEASGNRAVVKSKSAGFGGPGFGPKPFRVFGVNSAQPAGEHITVYAVPVR